MVRIFPRAAVQGKNATLDGTFELHTNFQGNMSLGDIGNDNNHTPQNPDSWQFPAKSIYSLTPNSLRIDKIHK